MPGNIDRRQRRRDHEDDQQNKNDVDERGDVDFMCLGEVVPGVEACAHDLTHH
jgi:hypothetical protein